MSDVAHDYADEQKYEKMLVNLNVIYWMSIFKIKYVCIVKNIVWFKIKPYICARITVMVLTTFTLHESDNRFC